MFVNMHLCVEVKNYNKAHLDAIENSIKQVLAEEQLAKKFGRFERSQDRNGNERLRVQTDRRFPISINRAYAWLSEVEKRFHATIATANGGPCDVRFLGDDLDEGDDSILW